MYFNFLILSQCEFYIYLAIKMNLAVNENATVLSQHIKTLSIVKKILSDSREKEKVTSNDGHIISAAVFGIETIKYS